MSATKFDRWGELAYTQLIQVMAKTLFLLIVALIGVTIGLLVTLTSVPFPANPTLDDRQPELGAQGQKLIPQEIQGFEQKRLDRAEPTFPGELFSVHAQFVPLPGSRYEQWVESLGISVFRLEDSQASDEIKPLLLMGDPSELTFRETRMELFANADAGLVGLIWQLGRDLYHVRVSSQGDVEFDAELLREAALGAADALMEGRQR